MRLILLGGPGAGKGTQSSFIAEKYQIPKVSTGDMLREAIRAESDIGHQAKILMDRGELVPDDVIIDLVKARIEKVDCKDGFLLDGFPRTIGQAEALIKNGVLIDAVIEIRVDDEEIVKRISGRRVHLESGRTYHVIFSKPAQDGVDDVTGEPLVQRKDDEEDTVRKRLSVYHKKTEPLVNYYRTLHENKEQGAPHFASIKGTGEVEDISNSLFAILESL